MSELHEKFGTLLKIERERQNIDLKELAEQLKISQENLVNIEKGNVSSIPSELYYNLFAKSYAEALGIDYGRTIDAIKDDIFEAAELPEGQTKHTDEEISNFIDEKESGTSKEGTENSVLIKKFMYLLIIIIVSFGLFMIINSLFLSDGEPEINSEASINNHDESGTETSTDENQAVNFANYNWEVPQYKKPEKLKLKLQAQDQCWATIYSDGEQVIYKNLRPWIVYEVEAEYRLMVSIGIPSKVNIELNGQPVDLTHPETKRISRVEINQMNLNSFLNSENNKTHSDNKTGIDMDNKSPAPSPAQTADRESLDKGPAPPLQTNETTDDSLINKDTDNEN